MNKPCVRLAPTGIAAHLIKGRTIHNFFRLDYDCASSLEKGVVQAIALARAEVIIIDEFSMIEKTLLETVDRLCRDFTEGTDHLSFGGKSAIVILIEDPVQLPAIGASLFDSHHIRYAKNMPARQ